MRIVVGVDFSAGSAAAFEEALALRSRLRAELVLVHVVEGYWTAGWTPSQEAREWLERMGIPENAVRIRYGFPWVELVRAATETEAMMIIVGSHGASGFQPVAAGSVVSRLVVLSARPVLVVTARRNGSGRGARREQRLDAVEPNPFIPPAAG